MPLLRRLPNLLSASRLVAVPALLALAWFGWPFAFLLLFALALVTDVIDGFVARRWNATSELGARLDSWGDLATYLVLPLCAWWLWPERILAQKAWIAVAVLAFLAPTLIGLAKFRRLPSYHTWLAKLVANVMGIAVVLFFGFDADWVIGPAVALLVFESLEEIAITAVLPAPRTNVRSIFRALALAREPNPKS